MPRDSISSLQNVLRGQAFVHRLLHLKEEKLGSRYSSHYNQNNLKFSDTFLLLLQGLDILMLKQSIFQ